LTALNHTIYWCVWTYGQLRVEKTIWQSYELGHRIIQLLTIHALICFFKQIFDLLIRSRTRLLANYRKQTKVLASYHKQLWTMDKWRSHRRSSENNHKLYGVPIHVVFILCLRHVADHMFKHISKLCDLGQSITWFRAPDDKTNLDTYNNISNHISTIGKCRYLKIVIATSIPGEANC